MTNLDIAVQTTQTVQTARRFPQFLQVAIDEMDAALESYQRAQDNGAGIDAEIAHYHLRNAYQQVAECLQRLVNIPQACQCGGELEAVGNVYRCTICGRVYEPDPIAIPF